MFEACEEMMQDKNPRIQQIGKEEKGQLRQLLEGPRLSRSHLNGLTFLLSRKAPPTWIHMLPGGNVNSHGRARFENVPTDAAFELALVEVPGQAKAQRKDAADTAYSAHADRLQSALQKPILMRAYAQQSLPFPVPPEPVVFNLSDRRVIAEIRSEANGQATLLLWTSAPETDGATVRFRIGGESYQRHIEFRGQDRWDTNLSLRQSFQSIICELPDFLIDLPGSRKH
jgi:hypothetical protein